MSNIYTAILDIKTYCGSCGCWMLSDRTPVEYTDFDAFLDNKDLSQGTCYYCDKNKKRPFLWIGNLKNYFCFPDGTIYSFKHRKTISSFIDSRGYPAVKIYTGNIKTISGNVEYSRVTLRVHKIVAMKYIPLYQHRDLVIRHLDGNKLNSHYTNLCWGTPSENRQDYLLHKRGKNV